jgi:hypothetical protein
MVSFCQYSSVTSILMPVMLNPVALYRVICRVESWEIEMLKISKEQSEQMARYIFLDKLVAAFSRDIPSFAACDWEDRKSFLSEAVSLAASKGFKTEQGLASYALAVWWLGVDFENKSKELESLLQSSYPEVRKVQAMNEWVNAMIGNPKSVAAADEALKKGLRLTEPWGPPN